MTDDILFNTIAISATACFVLGLIEGLPPLLITSVILIVVLYVLVKKFS